MRARRRRTRLRPGLLSFVLAASCLTPTDSGSRFGELRVQPVFEPGQEPASIGVTIDSVHATVQRQDATLLVDTLMAYDGERVLGWVLELFAVSDVMDVTLELRARGTATHRGMRSITVDEGTVGRSVLENVPVGYVSTALATRIEVVPARTALTAVGQTRQLQAIAYDAMGAVIPGKAFAWSTADATVATIDDFGVVTAAGADSTIVRATADGVSGSATILVSLDGTLVRHADISTDSASLAANGVSSTLVSVTLRDADDNPVGASAGTVALTASLGSLGNVTDHGDGTYTATFTAGTTTGTATITGTLNGDAIADTAHVELRPSTPSATATTLEADSASLAANGASTTRVLVTVRDASGNPVGTSAGTVALAASLGSLGNVTDHGDGTYTATFTAGTTAGAARVIGTLNGEAIADTARIELRPSTPSATTTTIDADSASMVADGLSTTRVLVTVRDEYGNPAGASAGTLALAASLGSLRDIMDHGDGTYTAVFTAATTAGTATISGILNGAVIADTAQIELRPSTPSVTASTLHADSASMAADGHSSSLVTVTVRDAYGNLVGASAGTVVLAASLGSLGDVTDHGDGTYTATFTAGTTTGTATITGTLNGDAIADTAHIELRLPTPSATTTTLTADSASMVADGQSTTRVLVTVRDVYGNPVGASAGTVILATSLGSLGDITDHGDGTYTATFTAGTIAGSVTITGTLNGEAIADSAHIELRPSTPNATMTTLHADSVSIAANGISYTTVTVIVRDMNGNPVGASAGIVTLATTAGSLTNVLDHGDGTYTAQLRGASSTAGSGMLPGKGGQVVTEPDTAIVTGTLNGETIADTAVVELRIEPGSPMTTTIEADSTSLVTDVFSWTTITVTVRDATGAPVGASAGAVTLHTTAGHLGSVVDHGDGTYTAQLKAVGDSPQAVVTGTLNGAAIADSAVVEFRQGSREASTAPAASVRYAVSRYNDTSTDISFVEPRFTPANSRSQQRSSGS